jgi:hypothetical protein
MERKVLALVSAVYFFTWSLSVTSAAECPSGLFFGSSPPSKSLVREEPESLEAKQRS